MLSSSFSLFCWLRSSQKCLLLVLVLYTYTTVVFIVLNIRGTNDIRTCTLMLVNVFNDYEQVNAQKSVNQ